MREKLGLAAIPTLQNKALDRQQQLQHVGLHWDGL